MRNRALAVFIVTITIAIVAMMALGGYAVYTSVDASNKAAHTAVALAHHVQRDDIGHTRDLRLECNRVNIERAATNLNDLLSYKLDVKLAKIFVEIDRDYLHDQFTTLSQTYEVTASSRTWVPLTNCVHLPKKAPMAVLFKHELPPKSALVLGPDN